MEQLLSTNRCNNTAQNNACHCLLIQVSLYTIDAAISSYYRILCNGCMEMFHCEFIDIYSGYYIGISCISWTAILSDYCVLVSRTGDSNGPKLIFEEHDYSLLHGYVHAICNGCEQY